MSNQSTMGNGIIQRKFLALAWWSLMPGSDFDAPWAAWMIADTTPSWIYAAWTWFVEWPITRAYCALFGHVVWESFCGRPGRYFCPLCGWNNRDTQ